MTEKTDARSNILIGLGLKYNGEAFTRDDFNVHWTELTCDIDEEFDTKVEKIKTEMERRKNKGVYK